MPITPVQFQSRPYVRNGTLGEILRLRGRDQAEAILRSGDISARMWSDLGQNIAGGVNQYAKERQEAPIRAQEAKARELQLASAQREADQAERLNRQDSAFMALLKQQPTPDPKEVMAIYGPQRGMAIAQGLTAFGELQQGAVKDARDTAGRLAIGMKALSPQLQQTMWPQVRQSAIKGGLGDEQAIPESFTPDYLDAVIGWATGKAPETEAPGAANLRGLQTMRAEADLMPQPQEAPRPVELNEGAVLVDPVTGREIARGNPRREPTGARTPVWVQDKEGNFIDLAGVAPPGTKPASSREQGRPVTSGDAGRIAELDTSLDDVSVLRTAVSGNKATGTSAYVGSKVPNWVTEITGWGTDAKSKNAVIARVKQVIGKALEGGVLRKEDEEKYKDILPTISDVESVVTTKIDGLEKAIALRRQREIEARADAGYDVSQFLARQRGSGVTVNMRAPDGRMLQVPAEQVDEAKRRGATVVGQ